jgi:hypothetical protein
MNAEVLRFSLLVRLQIYVKYCDMKAREKLLPGNINQNTFPHE